MAAKSIKDITKALQVHFTSAKVPLTLPSESRRILQNFVDEYNADAGEEEAARANAELKNFWTKHVGDNPQRIGAFVGVLRELRPAIGGEANILEWWQLVVQGIISSTGYRKSALEDAREFLVGVMAREDDGEEDSSGRYATANRLCSDLLDIYISRTKPVIDGDDETVAMENAQVAQQAEDVLIAFGRKCPKALFHRLDDHVNASSTRLQALTLLSSFLRHQSPHLYLVINTPLVEHLLKCLINDTSTTILSVALTSLIMLMPHIPGSFGPWLPRLFLVYSRLLCWEKFSPLSTEAEKNLVTDDRVANDDDSDDEATGDVGIDLNWEKVQPEEGVIEASTPEVMTYFTYLYGLYPLNFMSYVRKPRRYLKNIDFPSAEEFDLDQQVIRSRTDQFRQVHLLHPNFYNMTVEEELVDPKWPKMDPADVVGECHGLCMTSKPSMTTPGPPPTSKLPDIPPVPSLSPTRTRKAGQISPTASHVSLRSANSWRDTQSTAVSAAPLDGDSPTLKPQDEDTLPQHLRPHMKPVPSAMRTSPSSDDVSRYTTTASPLPRSVNEKVDAHPQTNLAYLQRELTLLRNELNFERWHKAQYGEHIGQVTRRNVKEATVEAETLNLINANRALKKQLDQVRKARETTVKDSALTRKQANNLEANMTERFNKLRVEQETWQADADELNRLRSEIKRYRDLLVVTEARELNKSHQLELAQRDLEELQKLQAQLQHAQRRMHEYEYREFEFDNARRHVEIVESENRKLQTTIQKHEHEHTRLRQAYASKVTELEAQLGLSQKSPLNSPGSDELHHLAQQTLAECEAKLASLKKSHSKLLERHTDLELDYQALKSRLEQQRHHSSSIDADSTFAYDIVSGGGSSEYSASEPTRHPTFPTGSSIRRASAHAINQSAPLAQDEGGSGSGSNKKEKIQPDSTVRVYGRGGAQNIKLNNKQQQQQQQKESPSSESSSTTGGASKKKRSVGLRGLRNFV